MLRPASGGCVPPPTIVVLLLVVQSHLVRAQKEEQAHGFLDGLVADGGRRERRHGAALLESMVSLRHLLGVHPPLCNPRLNHAKSQASYVRAGATKVDVGS